MKVKGFTLVGDWTSPKMAATYDRWVTHQVWAVPLACICMLLSGHANSAVW